MSVDEGANFTQWKAGFPPVSTMDLSIQEREADLVIATFGRAIYVLDNIRPLRQLAANGRLLEGKIAAFANADAYQANYRDAHGAGFIADANFIGENRKKGAKLSYFYNPPKKDTTTAKTNTNVVKVKPAVELLNNVSVSQKDTTKKNVSKYDTVYVKIYNTENKLIRTLQHKPDSTGYQAIMWNMTEKGVRNPGTPKPKKNAADANGIEVLAGKYKLVFVCGDAKDSSSIEIKDDPRVLISKEVQMAKRALYARMQNSIVQLTEATDRLTEAEDVAKTIQSQVKDKEGKELEDLGKASKTIQDSIKVKREIITGRKFEKQGYGRPYQITPQGKIYEAMGYINSKQINPTNADVKLVEQLETLTKESIEKVNKFFATNWTEYRKKVESTPLKTFKDYSPIGEGK